MLTGEVAQMFCHRGPPRTFLRIKLPHPWAELGRHSPLPQGQAALCMWKQADCTLSVGRKNKTRDSRRDWAQNAQFLSPDPPIRHTYFGQGKSLGGSLHLEGWVTARIWISKSGVQSANLHFYQGGVDAAGSRTSLWKPLISKKEGLLQEEVQSFLV